MFLRKQFSIKQCRLVSVIERFGLEGTLKIILVPTPLPWARTSSIRSGCSKPHPVWPWTPPGRGHPQLLRV